MMFNALAAATNEHGGVERKLSHCRRISAIDGAHDFPNSKQISIDFSSIELCQIFLELYGWENYLFCYFIEKLINGISFCFYVV